jgi:uncharacterized protein (TIGR03437 family)
VATPVTVPAGSISGIFTATAGTISASQTATVTAVLNGAAKTVALTLRTTIKVATASTSATPKAALQSSPVGIAGQRVVVDRPGSTPPGSMPDGVPAGAPAISAGGIVNAASYVPGGPSDGSLAQGSLFSIYGSDLGPDESVKAEGYPLPEALGGVSVRITQGSAQYDAWLVLASKGQINAILPSTVPLGAAEVAVTYNGKTSAAATITVSKISVGVFFQQVDGQNMAIAQNVRSATDHPLNLPSAPAKPGQIVILWATGMGAIMGADNAAAGAGDKTGVPVTITAGGVTAPRVYAGRQPYTAAVDNISFAVPPGIPFGCHVRVAIVAGGVEANVTMIAVTEDGSPCQQ